MVTVKSYENKERSKFAETVYRFAVPGRQVLQIIAILDPNRLILHERTARRFNEAGTVRSRTYPKKMPPESSELAQRGLLNDWSFQVVPPHV